MGLGGVGVVGGRSAMGVSDRVPDDLLHAPSAATSTTAQMLKWVL